MALTKEDLQAIGQMMDSKLEPLKVDMQGVKSDLQEVKSGLQETKAGLQEAKVDIQEIKLGLQEAKADIQEIKERVTRIEITQENVILPRIQLLSEGHSGIVDRLERLDELPDQVEDIQTTVSVLKHVFKEHTHS